MALTKYKLGCLMIPFSQKCGITNLTPYQVSGVNKDKEFFEPSHQVGEDTSKYQIVPPRHFACNLMHVGRDRVLPIAYNHSSNNKIVSPAYTIFSLKESCGVLDDYLFIMLKCEELDRYFWFHADGSVRDGMSWSDFCDIEITVPDIPTQQKYVDIYNAMVANQQSYERGLEDLKLVCDGYIEDLRRQMPSEKIGKYIERHDVRNGQNGTKNVMGISTSKCFREPTSKVNKNGLANYKVCRPRQIGFVQTTHNEKVFTYAFNNTSEDIVVSSVNEVFSTNEDKLYPEYLCMFFNRTEFDRYARFHSWGSARETFTWSDLIEVEIPIPDIKVQKAIASIYKVYVQRKEINEQLKNQIKDICPILIRGSLKEGNTSSEF